MLWIDVLHRCSMWHLKCIIYIQCLSPIQVRSSSTSRHVAMSWLSTINHTSPFCDRASCCPWLEFAWENGGSRSPSRYVSRSQDDTGQHLRPSEVAQCAKAFAHPAIAWGFGGNIIDYRNDMEIADNFCRSSEFSMVITVITVLYGRLVLGCETESKTPVQLHVPGWRKIRRAEKSKGHDGHDSQSIPDPYGYPGYPYRFPRQRYFGMCFGFPT